MKVKTIKYFEDGTVEYRFLFLFTPDMKVQTIEELIVIKPNYIKVKDFLSNDNKESKKMRQIRRYLQHI